MQYWEMHVHKLYPRILHKSDSINVSSECNTCMVTSPLSSSAFFSSRTPAAGMLFRLKFMYLNWKRVVSRKCVSLRNDVGGKCIKSWYTIQGTSVWILLESKWAGYNGESCYVNSLKINHLIFYILNYPLVQQLKHTLANPTNTSVLTVQSTLHYLMCLLECFGFGCIARELLCPSLSYLVLCQ